MFVSRDKAAGNAVLGAVKLKVLDLAFSTAGNLL